MKKFIVVIIAAALFSATGFAQEQEVHHRSGARRQLATILFAGLGGAIIGLSTLSFYGRPQDQLSNIAIGFAVGIIGGTVYVTFRSATTRDYYEPAPNPQGLFNKSLLENKFVENTGIDSGEESPFQYGPLITKITPEPGAPNAYGGLVQYHF